jgi:hypothetical protein
MSPTIATFRPANCALRLRIVNASSRACVGCSCAPSPALTIDVCPCDARKCGAPASECRITMKSGDIASRLRSVSSSVSPLTRLEVEVEKFSESAERRFSASSNDDRVRVDGSTKKFTTVLPRRVGTFLISRVAMSENPSAVSRIKVISPGFSDSMPSKCGLDSLMAASPRGHRRRLRP